MNEGKEEARTVPGFEGIDRLPYEEMNYLFYLYR